MHTAKFLALCLTMLLSARAFAAGSVLILDYHTFLDSKNSSIDFSLDELASQLDRMASLGYRFVSLGEAMAGKLEGTKNIAITIDDGNHSVEQAFDSVFRPRNIRPDLFIYPAVIWGTPHFLDRYQLRALMDEGCAVGAHGYHHVPMSGKAFRRNPRDVLDEANKPGPSLLSLTGKTPTLFAYPYGVAGSDARDAVRKAGYSWAFLADEHFVFVDPSDPTLDRFGVPRTIVYRWNRDDLFKLLEARASN